MKKYFVFFLITGSLYSCSDKKENNDAAQTTSAVTVWENTGFTGQSTEFSETASWIGEQWNDRISSFKVKKGFTVTFYGDANYGAANVSLKGPAEYNCNAETNDYFSSVKIVKD